MERNCEGSLIIRWISLALWIAAFVTTAAADKKSEELEARLNSEFVGKSYTTKILLGSFASYYDSALRKDCHRLIDTEFSNDGSIRFLARRGCLEGDLLAPPFYVRPDAMTGVRQPKTTVWVRKIELKDNRIEFWLSSDPASNTVATYAKIKFMLGKGYQDKEYKTLVSTFARAIRVESYERILSLETEHATLTNRLNATEARYRAASRRGSDKLQVVKDLRDVLEKLAQNRLAYTAAGGTNNDGTDYLGRTKAVDREIAILEEEVRTEAIQKLRVRLQATASEAGRIKAILQSEPPTSMPEWQRRSEALTSYRRLLEEWRTLYGDLQSGGESVPVPDLEKLQQETQEATQYGDALERCLQRVQLVQLNTEYKEMGQRRVQLLGAYTKAFGTTQERPALQELIAHLVRMRSNREEASKWGSTTAVNEAAQLEREIEKLRKR